MGTQEPIIRVRINQIDYTVTQAGPLDNTVLPRVPIIRIYGTTSIGKKACVHVHQVYPYFFVEYHGKMNPESVNRYIARLALSLNHAIAVSMKRNPHSPNSQFVRAILLVKGVHFYGFHTSYSPFLKILIADPVFVNRAVTIMRSGTIMKTRFRVYESHLGFILQFMCDFGLYGCGWIDLAETWQRGQDEDGEERPTNSEESSLQSSFKMSSYFRQSRMPLELDVVAHQILNRHQLAARNLHHQLSIPASPLPPEPLIISVRELWEDERRRRLARGLSPSPDIPRDLSENSRGSGGEWVAEARWWGQIRKRIEEERGKEKVMDSRKGWEKWVMTTFESVEALWEDRWKTWKPGEQDEGGRASTAIQEKEEREANPFGMATGQIPLSQSLHEHGENDVDIDEDILCSQELSRIVEHEEAEWENLVGGQRDNDEDVPVDEDAAEDGPPPELQYSDSEIPSDSKVDIARSPNHIQRTPGKNSQLKRYNPFQSAWMKLAGPSKSRSTSVISGSEYSPDRSRMSSIVSPSPSVSPFKLVAHSMSSSSTYPLEDADENPFLNHSDFNSLPESREDPCKESLISHSAVTATSVLPMMVPTLPEAHMVQGGTFSELPFPQYPQRNDESPSGWDEPETLTDDNPYTLTPEERLRKRRKVDHSISSMTLPIPPPSTPAIVRFPRASQTFTTSFASLQARNENVKSYQYAPMPLAASQLLASMDEHGIPSKIYQNPYYSKDVDAPEHPREYAGLVFHLKGGEGLGILDEWVVEPDEQKSWTYDVPQSGAKKLDCTGIWGWEYAGSPPTRSEVRRWMKDNNGMEVPNNHPKRPSQIHGPTQANPYGLKATPAAPLTTAVRESGNMDVFSLEVFAPSREEKRPDPGEDEVVAVFWSFRDSRHQRSDGDLPLLCESGVIVVKKPQLRQRKIRDWTLDVVETELDLLNRVVDVIQELDPDIVVGWEVQAASWGYLSARGRTYGLDIGEQISRAGGRTIGGGSDQWGMRTTSTFKVIGRHVLNLWRIIRAEQNFTSYTYENAVFQLLRRRTPHYSSSTLTSWYNSAVPEHVSRLLRYFSTRTTAVLEILDAGEVVTKNAEFARVFGVDFSSVLSRGSQFKVESFMFRIAKPESFVLLSPSRDDVGKQNAAECMPLIMEPLSAFYSSPLVVLDFQSLYPSIMIAYNYCYSTCIGRVTDFKGQNKFGVTELHQPAGLLDTLQDHINVAPNGIMYVKPEVRKGLLGRMLTELLDTRVMVKQAMKGAKDDKALRRVLDARQLGLKFIANVTYGYTSATYSGRMPAVEIADSIVQSGRETLEKAIRIIDSTKKWGAKVVYGDTDSLFIYLKGKTKEQAFRIGHDMADTITAMNPAPVKLKFEKVYLPCVLMAKKRYVGFKFETPDDKEPVFDAKGIETVRRDGVPAQQKMTETCLKILFRSQDLSKVKEYCCTAWAQILENKVSLQDFIFAKEVKMGTYSDKGPPPPGVAVAARRMVEDPNDEPQYGERIPYVIIRGQPGTRLVDRAVSPQEVLNDNQKHIDSAYYISRVLIPPLERIFNLVGADVRSWYEEMPKMLRADQLGDSILMSPRKVKQQQATFTNRLKIDEHFVSSRCLTCNSPTSAGVCDVCHEDHQVTLSRLLSRIHLTEERLKNVQMICASCSGSLLAEPVECDSLDCPWLFERKKTEHKADALSNVEDLIGELVEEACSDEEDENQRYEDESGDEIEEKGEDSEVIDGEEDNGNVDEGEYEYELYEDGEVCDI